MICNCRTWPWGSGLRKGTDGANTLGPVLVTPDELEPHRHGKGFALSMTGWVNGEATSEGSLAVASNLKSVGSHP